MWTVCVTGRNASRCISSGENSKNPCIHRAVAIVRPHRRGGRVVEGAPLLREYTSKAYRGFESHLLRHSFNCDVYPIHFRHLGGRAIIVCAKHLCQSACAKFRRLQALIRSLRCREPRVSFSRFATLSPRPAKSLKVSRVLQRKTGGARGCRGGVRVRRDLCWSALSFPRHSLR